MNNENVLQPLGFYEKISIYKRMILEIGYLIARNLFILVNVIIFTVVGLLIYFGDTREGLSLALIISINIIFGIIQDINAWIVLERLQLLTALRVTRLHKNGTREIVSQEALNKGDSISLSLGESVPCDSTLTKSQMLEVSESIITGESSSFPRAQGEKLLAGSIITAGSGIATIDTPFRESRIAKMTARVKRYTVNRSPIQQTINTVVTYTGYILILVILFIVTRGSLIGAPWLETIKTIGALSAVLVPQGLIVSATLLFAFGGIHFYRRHVLLREVNATEKLARIKNLCVDKTGTLTENALSVETIIVPKNIKREYAEGLMQAYIDNSGDASEIMRALADFLDTNKTKQKTLGGLPFSSWRQYGGVLLGEKEKDTALLAGTPEVFTPLMSEGDRKWIMQHVKKEAGAGKRVFCIISTKTNKIPQTLKNSSLELTPIALFVLTNQLREGTRTTIDFFQARGVRIRVLSGDNTETIQAVTRMSGINEPEKIITGDQMQKWDQADFDEHAKEYTIFARIVPEQKEHIIDALKKDGFTGMIGDGANDALAIKKADVGIAMFDGAPATRQIAAVVLMHNSFAELPSGVRLADNMIENLYIFGAVFLNQTALGFFLYVFLTALGNPFPFSPLNIAFTSYFAIGIPNMLISYWSIRPSGKICKVSKESFLRKVLPYSLVSGAMSAVILTLILLVMTQGLKTPESATLGVLAFSILGYIFFIMTPVAYNFAKRALRKWEILGTGVFATGVAIILFSIPFVRTFFDLSIISLSAIVALIPIFFGYALIQYLLARGFSRYVN